MSERSEESGSGTTGPAIICTEHGASLLFEASIVQASTSPVRSRPTAGRHAHPYFMYLKHSSTATQPCIDRFVRRTP